MNVNPVPNGGRRVPGSYVLVGSTTQGDLHGSPNGPRISCGDFSTCARSNVPLNLKRPPAACAC